MTGDDDASRLRTGPWLPDRHRYRSVVGRPEPERRPARRPPHRQIGLLQHVGDHIRVGAAAAQPHGQPRRRPPVQLVERQPVTGGDAADEFLLVDRVQTSSHTQKDDVDRPADLNPE